MVDNDAMNEKNVVLVIKATQLSAKLLAKALKLIVGKVGKKKNHAGKGQQTVKQLVRQGKGASSFVIDDESEGVQAFEKIAKKYGVDFSVVKNPETSEYLVFFKPRDASVLETAFKEFVVKVAQKEKKGEKDKPAFKETLKRQAEKTNDRQRERTQQRDRGQER